MKIGIGISAYCNRPLEERYKIAKAHGYDSVDFGMSVTEAEPYNLSDAEAEAMLLANRRYAEEAGIEITQVHGPWRWPPQDGTEEERAERMEKMKRCLHYTALLGCKYMVVHPIMPFYINDIGTGNEAATWQINLDYYRELLVTAREENVIIALENMPMPQFSIGSPEQILQFVTEINDPFMKVCLDTGHVSVYDKRQPSEAVYLLKDWIKVLHVHDNGGRGDEHLLPCSRTGVIDWPAFGKALRDIGYEGSFTYETAPTRKLPQPAWDDVSRALVKLGHWIVGDEISD
ncbi:MAG: sugar phosphate isomerase/epimerase [Clostridia bacterium]|nr:sugar phosphate isomerase/epimerase [Clostridia bacterium]